MLVKQPMHSSAFAQAQVEVVSRGPSHLVRGVDCRLGSLSLRSQLLASFLQVLFDLIQLGDQLGRGTVLRNAGLDFCQMNFQSGDFLF
jgi:hypothetical protein